MFRSFKKIATLLLAGGLAAGALANPRVNSVQSGGFNAGSPALVSYTAPVVNRWGAESAALVVGPLQGIQPYGTGMLHILEVGGTVSQVSQRVDLSSLAAEIDAGRVSVRFQALFNSAEPAAVASVNLRARSSFLGTVLEFLAPPSLNLDASVATWQPLSVGAGDDFFVLPTGTRFVESEVLFRNDSITPAGGGFVDEAYLLIKVSELRDGCFEPNTPALVPFTAPVLNRWAAEAANLLVAPTSGITPIDGGMLRLNKTSLTASQVSQYVDVSHLAGLIDSGFVTARFRAMVNTPDTTAKFGQAINARTALFGAILKTMSTGSLDVDDDPNTWEEFKTGDSTVLTLPFGTRVIEAQVFFPNSSLTPGGGGFVDQVCLELICNVTGFGIQMTPLGDANLSPVQDPNDPNGPPASMIISNLGSSGEDGISINLDQTFGAHIGMSPLTPDEGATRTLRAYCNDGSSFGFTEQVSGGAMLISADYSEVSATSHRILIFDGSTIVQDITGHTGATDVQVTNGGSAAETVYALECENGEDVIVCYLPEVEVPVHATMTVPGNPPVQGTGWAILPENATINAQYMTDLSITGTDAGGFSVLSGWVSPPNSIAAALGSATLRGAAAGGDLIIDNIGSCGEDGIAIQPDPFGDLNNTSNDIEDDQFIAFDGGWNDLDPNGTAPDGAFLEFASTGQVAGQAGQSLGTMRITQSADPNMGSEITVDYSAVGSTTHRIEILSGGVVIATITGHSGVVATVTPDGPAFSAQPTGCRKGRAVIDGQHTACFFPSWPTPVRFSIDGGASVTGDGIRVLAENPSGAFEAIERFDVRLAGYPTMTLTAVTFETACPGDADGDNDVDISDLGLLLSQFGMSGAGLAGDVDGDGDVDISDLGLLLANFGTTCP